MNIFNFNNMDGWGDAYPQKVDNLPYIFKSFEPFPISLPPNTFFVRFYVYFTQGIGPVVKLYHALLPTRSPSKSLNVC